MTASPSTRNDMEPLPGDPALEVSARDATENYRDIFTDCLLKGLNGSVPDLIVNIGNSHLNEERWVVPSWELRPYLEQEVPDAAASVHIKLQQEPDIRVESHPPNYLAEFTRPGSTSIPRTARPTDPEQVTFRHVLRSLKDDRYFQGHIQDGSLPPSTKGIAERSKMAGAINRLMEGGRRNVYWIYIEYQYSGPNSQAGRDSLGRMGSEGRSPRRVESRGFARCDADSGQRSYADGSERESHDTRVREARQNGYSPGVWLVVLSRWPNTNHTAWRPLDIPNKI